MQPIVVCDGPVGPNIVSASLEEVLRAVEAAPRGDDWPTVRELVIPVIPRLRPHPPGSPAPLTTLLAPGVVVGFGIDIGPAFISFTHRQLEILGITEPEVVSQALANLLVRAERVRPASITHGSIDGIPVAAIQTGQSIGSALVLVPDQLARLFGPKPRVFLAPMRDLMVSLPRDVDLDVAAFLFEEIASQDPNCLPPIAYRFDGAQITRTWLAVDALTTRSPLM